MKGKFLNDGSETLEQMGVAATLDPKLAPLHSHAVPCSAMHLESL